MPQTLHAVPEEKLKVMQAEFERGDNSSCSEAKEPSNDDSDQAPTVNVINFIQKPLQYTSEV